ncbi:DUF2849 domain-containing protein [Thalassococcus lentus]|uniref:DUF2849 domain-containing protein n=1 Tax=Thalassococcus lentus TaxID=1210524 RepID=A0ABT4XRQ8_9RHOB|nr:DUF2849 domain-containing protein [Thalassococcus lentus]MDA7424641.1 DUF2849 domain-containing protein [Thalassococcus lentus]
MTIQFKPHVITANALVEGDVIYLTDTDGWTRALSEAEVLTDEAHAQLRLLEAQARSGEAVGVYLAQVALRDGAPEPVHFREDFRRTGPSNYPHGKQAEAL